MAIPLTAVEWPELLGTEEVKNYRVLAGLSLAPGEAIQAGTWSLTAFAETAAAGVEIITGDGTYPDPELDVSGQAIDLWFRLDPLSVGDAAFADTGTKFPFEFTFYADTVPPRKINTTLVLQVAEKGDAIA